MLVTNNHHTFSIKYMRLNIMHYSVCFNPQAIFKGVNLEAKVHTIYIFHIIFINKCQ